MVFGGEVVVGGGGWVRCCLLEGEEWVDGWWMNENVSTWPCGCGGYM